MSVVVMCAHGGKATPVAPNPRVKCSGVPIPLSAPPFVIAGCPFVMPVPPPVPSPHPCLSAAYMPPTMTVRVKSMGMPLLVQTSMTFPAITVPPAPPLPLMPVSFPGQVRVKAM
jgi:hypothetical protein